MYKVKLNEKEYFLPANWSEVTFKQLLDLKKIKFDSNEGNIMATTHHLSVLMGMDKKEIGKLSSADFKKLAETTKWIHSFDIQPEVKHEFEFDGVKYKLITKFDSMTVGEIASIEQLSIDGVEDNLDKIMAILIREVDADGNILVFDANTIDSRAEILKNKMTIPVVHGISNFFLSGNVTSTPITMDSSEQSNGIQIEEM